MENLHIRLPNFFQLFHSNHHIQQAMSCSDMSFVFRDIDDGNERRLLGAMKLFVDRRPDILPAITIILFWGVLHSRGFTPERRR